LGVRRVAADGPLAEVRELAQRHEDRVATLLLPLDELLAAAVKRLNCTIKKASNSNAHFLDVRTPPSKSHPDIKRSQIVRVGPMGLADAWISVSSLVGPYSEALDMARALRALSSAAHIRVTLDTFVEPKGEFVVVETILRRRRLDPYTFAN